MRHWQRRSGARRSGGGANGSKTRCRCGTVSVERTGHAALLSSAMRCCAMGCLSEAESRLIQAKELALRLLDQRGLAESKRLLGLIHLRRGDKQKRWSCVSGA